MAKSKMSYDIMGTDYCMPDPSVKSKPQSSVSFAQKSASYDEVADVVGADQGPVVKPSNKGGEFVKGSPSGKAVARGEGHRFSVEYK